MTEKIALCQLDEIKENTSKGFKIDDNPIFVVHKDGEYYVFQNKCPHLQIELEWMPDQFLDTDSALIQCSTHGALFLIESGECVAGPCLGDKLQIIQHSIENNTLLIAADLQLD